MGIRMRAFYGTALIAAIFMLLITVGAGTAAAQAEIFDAKGFQQGHGSLSEFPFEHIDASTGNVVLTFSDLVLPGNGGHDFVWQRTYNSAYNTATGGQGYNGWTFGMPRTAMAIADSAVLTNTLPRLYKADG